MKELRMRSLSMEAEALSRGEASVAWQPWRAAATNHDCIVWVGSEVVAQDQLAEAALMFFSIQIIRIT